MNVLVKQNQGLALTYRFLGVYTFRGGFYRNKYCHCYEKSSTTLEELNYAKKYCHIIILYYKYITFKSYPFFAF